MMRMIRPLILGLALAACAEPTGPPTHLDVDLAVSSSVVQAESPVTIAVTVTNRGSDVVTIAVNVCPQAFVVLTGEVEIVGLEAIVCATIRMIDDLAPGEQLTFRYDRRGGSNGNEISGPLGSLPSGDYWIEGRCGQYRSVPVRIRVTVSKVGQP